MTRYGPPTGRPPTSFYGSRRRNVLFTLFAAARSAGRRAWKCARRLLAFALDLLLPRVCLACPAPARRSLSLCADCRRLLEPAPGAAAERPDGRDAGGDRPESRDAGSDRTDGSGEAGDRLEGCDAFFWLWAYRPPIDQVILALKHRRLDYLGRHMADEAIAVLGPELRRAELVVPMPMHWRRRLVRGRNHAASIARPLAERLERPLRPVLRRRTLGRPQAGRNRRQRLASPDVAFHCRKPGDVRERVVLLVDDVVTTGATAGRAARCLRAAGAAEVIVFVPARTLDREAGSSAIVRG